MMRISTLIVLLCALILCSMGPEPSRAAGATNTVPRIAPKAPIVRVSQTKVPAKTPVAPQNPITAKSPEKAPEVLVPAPPAATTDAGSGDFEKAVETVEGMRQAGDFSEALDKLTQMQEQFSKNMDQIAGLQAKVNDTRRKAMDFDYAVKQLIVDDQMAADVAIEKLTEGGEVARIVLRKAVRVGTDEIAGEAAALLGDLGEERAAAVIVARFLKKTDSPSRPKFLDSLQKLVGAGPATVLAPLYPLIKGDTQYKQKDVAGVLGTVFEKVCENNGDELDKVLGEPGAFAALKKYIQGAIVFNDVAVQRWASEQAPGFGILVPGIRGAYYHGSAFETLAFERLDEQMWVEDRKFPYPDNRQDGISIRWTGKVLIATAGSYTFRVASDDGNRLTIDGKLCWDKFAGGPADQKVTLDLTVGLHDIQVEFQQGGGGAWIHTSWSGPGFQEKPLTKEVLRVMPWPAATVPAGEKKP